MQIQNPIQNQQRTLIAIIGNIGAGKSTLCQNINQILPDSCIIKEKFENNPYLKQYYEALESKDPIQIQKFSFYNQIEYLRQNMDHVIKYNKNQSKYIISDRIIEECSVFTNQMFNSGYLDENQKKLVNDFVQSVMKLYSVDKMIKIYLRCDDANVLKTRISERGRNIEKELTLDYLQSLNDEYELNYANNEHIVDAKQDKEAVLKQVMEIINNN